MLQSLLLDFNLISATWYVIDSAAEQHFPKYVPQNVKVRLSEQKVSREVAN